jgi:tRNA C32,U32 (ribose-2'-O)-methylase TrmJ
MAAVQSSELRFVSLDPCDIRPKFSQRLIIHIRSFNCYTYGNEGCGLPREDLAKQQVLPFTIAGTGAIESLNVVAAVNFCHYELNRPS